MEVIEQLEKVKVIVCVIYTGSEAYGLREYYVEKIVSIDAIMQSEIPLLTATAKTITVSIINLLTGDVVCEGPIDIETYMRAGS